MSMDFGHLLIDPSDSKYNPDEIASVVEAQIIALNGGVTVIGDMLVLLNDDSKTDTLQRDAYQNLGFMLSTIGDQLNALRFTYECALHEVSVRTTSVNATREQVSYDPDGNLIEIAGCSCGAKFYNVAAIDDHECPLEHGDHA